MQPCPARHLVRTCVMMKAFRVAVLLVLSALGTLGVFGGVARAQVKSPALDPNCYFPSLTDPSQTQVLRGNSSHRNFGAGMLNIGPAPGESRERLYLKGLPPGPPWLMSSIRVDQSLDLTKPDVQAMMSMPFQPYGTSGSGPTIFYVFATGHFHTRDRVDLLMHEQTVGEWRIYWADEHGLYDSTRYSELNTSFYLLKKQFGASLTSTPYIANLTSDTVEDLVFAGGGPTVPPNDTNLSFRVYLFRGGASLFDKGPLLIEDSSSIYWQGRTSDSLGYSLTSDNWDALAGDFRGTGRKDLVIGPGPNMFFYRNDPPFSLARLAHSIRYDTLSTARETHKIRQSGVWLAMPVFAEAHDDFVFSYVPTNGAAFGLSIIKGGPEFGKTHLMLDSPDFFIDHPEALDSRFGGGHWLTAPPLMNCGDLTGTGRNVLLYQSDAASADGTSFDYYQFYYVLGDGMDERADMLTGGYKAYAMFDTISVRSDGRQDLALGVPNVDDTIGGSSYVYDGRAEIIYGTSKIPVPKGAVTERSSSSFEGELQVRPNPARSEIFVSWGEATSGLCHVRLLDVLGRTVLEADLKGGGNSEEFALTLPPLPSGLYELELAQGTLLRRAKVLVRQ